MILKINCLLHIPFDHFLIIHTYNTTYNTSLTDDPIKQVLETEDSKDFSFLDRIYRFAVVLPRDKRTKDLNLMTQETNLSFSFPVQTA